MNCREFERYVDAYVEGTLDSSRSRAMDEHIASCPSCSEVVQTLRTVMSSLDDTVEVRAPEGFADRLFARIESESTGRIIPFPANTTDTAAGAVTCESFGDQVAAFVDGSLDGARDKQMADHRNTCAACARLANAHEAVLRALTSAEPVTAPVGFAARIRAAVATETVSVPARAASSLRKLDFLVAACVSIMVLTGLFLLIPGNSLSTGEQTGIAALVDTLTTRLMVAPLVFKAWVAATIPAEHWILINRLTAPRDIPFLPVRFSMLFYLCAGFTTLTSLLIARKYASQKMALNPYLK